MPGSVNEFDKGEGRPNSLTRRISSNNHEINYFFFERVPQMGDD